MNSKRIFISGGAGVIGLEMIPRLVKRGATVIVGDLKSRPKEFAPSVIYRQGDLNTLTSEELSQYDPHVFIHLAATFERSAESYEFWGENYWHNVHLSHHLMTLVKDLKSLQRVIFASSYLIYDPALYQFGEVTDNAVDLCESDPVLPRNLVGAAKFSHEIELRFIDQFRSGQFTTACARIFRGYGRNSRDVISRWVRDLLKGKSITVYRPEGLFDYIYAADSAEGLIRLAECGEQGIINLGTGRARRVQDVVDILRQHFPEMVANIVDSDIPFEASQADMNHYQSSVGWRPAYSLETAIPEIIEYERQKLQNQTIELVRIPKVLVSSASRKAPLVLAVQKAALKLHPRATVVAGDYSANALTAYVADEFWQMPPTTDEYIADILEGCTVRGITAVFPTRDGELLFWARHAELFRKAGVTVIVSPPDSIERCVNKMAFAEFGIANGFPFIPTAWTLDGMGSRGYVVKECFGAGARSIGLNLDQDAANEHAKTLQDPIFQPYVQGTEISVDAWLDKNYKVKGVVLRRREILAAGESVVTTTFQDPVFELNVISILQALKLCGPVVLQAMVTDQDQLQIIECNARFGGASTTSLAAGLDSFYWSLLESLGEGVGECVFARVPGEVRQVRLPSDLHFYIHDSNL